MEDDLWWCCWDKGDAKGAGRSIGDVDDGLPPFDMPVIEFIPPQLTEFVPSHEDKGKLTSSRSKRFMRLALSMNIGSVGLPIKLGLRLLAIERSGLRPERREKYTAGERRAFEGIGCTRRGSADIGSGCESWGYWW